MLSTDGHEGAVYELGGDVAWTFDELARRSARSGRTRRGRTAPSTPEEHARILTEAGLDEGTAGFVVALDGNIRDGALADVTGDAQRAHRPPDDPLRDGSRALAQAA